MPTIVKGKDRCIEAAVSVARGFLGYKSPIPACMKNSRHSKSIPWIARNAHGFFPRHQVAVFCNLESSKGCKVYNGPYIPAEFGSDWLVMFEYHLEGESIGHFVIGDPYIYGNLCTDIIVAVNTKEKHGKSTS